MFQLVSTDDLGRRLVFPLVKIKTILGRDVTCDIVLDDGEVSREHTKVYIIDKVVQIKDMQSTNGTFLNNLKINKMTDVKVGDQLIVGPNMFELEQVEQVNKKEVDLTCMLTVEQLRDFADKPIPERPSKADEESGEGIIESTMISNHSDLIAGVYHKKIGVAKFPSIEIIFGEDSGMKYLLPVGEYKIGRDKKSNIRLNDDKISFLHGTLISKEGGVTYQDNESLNGSILNNKNVIKAKLQHKDILMLGRTKIRYLDPGKTDVFSTSNQIIGNNGGKGLSNKPDIIDLLGKYWYLGLGGVLLAILITILLLND